MSASEEIGRGGEVWDAPNQQVVRADGSGPADEGTGGGGGEPGPSSLEAKTKAQLLDYAAAQGVEANDSMTKADIIAAIEAAA